MEWMRRAARRFRLLLHREAAERLMASEIQHHIDCETDELVRQGMTRDAARRQATLAFGNAEAIKEEVRDALGTRLVEDVGSDLRYGWRVLRRTPGVTVSAVLTFGLGVGVATTIFSAVYGVLLRPLPYAAPNRLVAVWERDVAHNHDRNVVSLDNFEAWRDRAHTIGEWAALMPISVTVADRSSPERVIGADVSYGYFHLLGAAPALGRDFQPDDAREGQVTILSDAYWKRRYAGDPSIVGRITSISGKPYQIVGVMPASFDPPRFGWLGDQALWFPLVRTEQKRAWGRFLLVVGRLRDRAALEASQAEMRTVAALLEHDVPGDAGWSSTVVPLEEEITGNVRTTFLVLLGAVSLLLLMAITNVGTLIASAARRRRAELAIRRAIGATDRRLFRQLFVQSALLAALGTGAGLVIAAGGIRLLVALLPPDVPRLSSIRLDAPVFVVSTAITVCAALLFGMLAAASGREEGGVAPLALAGEEMRGPSRSGGRWLVAIEIAFALALGLMSMLMIRTLANLRAVDLGFVAEGVTVARVALPSPAYPSDESRRAFFDRLLERVRAIPGVTAAGLVSTRPLGGIGPATTVKDPRVPPSRSALAPIADVRYADAGAFDALGVQLVAGRAFGADAATAPPTVVISRDLADAFWPHDHAVGRSISVDMYNGITAHVIGVVGSVHLIDARTPVRPIVFLPAARFPDGVRDIVIRSRNGDAIVPALRAVVAELDISLPLYAIRAMPNLIGETLASDRFTTSVLVVFASAAALLAAVGVFGVFAADVARRRKEIGVRLALGASGGRVISLMLGQALGSAGGGVLAGTLIAFGASRAMKALLFGVSPADPASLALVIALLLAIAILATVMPVVRALRRSPLSALREG